MPERVRVSEFYDCKDDLKLIASYADIGVGPAVGFDGAFFTSPVLLRAFIEVLSEHADWLESVAVSA